MMRKIRAMYLLQFARQTIVSSYPQAKSHEIKLCTPIKSIELNYATYHQGPSRSYLSYTI